MDDMMELCIRKADQSDLEQIWEIFSQVIHAGDTYVFDPDTPRADLEKHWFSDHLTTFVLESNGDNIGNLCY